MKNKERFARIGCSALALLLCGGILAGCKGEDKPAPGTTGGSQGSVSEEPSSSDPYASGLPDGLTFGDRKVTMVCRDMEGVRDEFYATKESKGVIPEAVYGRNSAVEENLHVRLEMTMIADDSTNTHATIARKVEQEIMGGLCSYQIVTAPNYTVAPGTLEGYYLDLNRLNWMDTEKYYWSQGYNEVASVGQAQYTATGMAALSLYRFMYVTVYNNRVFEANGLENLFDAVNENRWTMEYQYELASGLYSDLNNIGERDAEDAYGFLSGARTSVDSYWVSCRSWVIGKDDDNFYTYTANAERLSGMVDKVLKLYYRCDGSYIIPYGQDNTDNAEIVKVFSRGNTAMANMKIYAIENGLQKLDFEFSIVPLPKYDELQQSYYTNVQDQVTVLAVPRTVAADDREMIGAVTESLAYEGYRHIYPAYFESTLPHRYLKNPQSAEMLRLIYESSNFVMVYQGLATEVGWTTLVRNMIRDKANTVSSALAGAEEGIPEALNKINGKFRELANKKQE